MAFNSLHFLIFFPIVSVLYYLLPHSRRWILLAAASLYFYMAWRAVYVLLLIGAIVVTYYAGLKIAEETEDRVRRRYFAGATVILIGNLFVFKYFNFFNENVRELFQAVGLSYGLHSLNLILPIGISFYTFQKVAYLLDIYRKKQEPERHFGIFTLFASFYPQLVAGPIERASNLLPQFRERHEFDYEGVSSGLRLMAWGFFKKTVVADRLAPFADRIYQAPADFSDPSVLLATLFFTFQIYCDFSAYSDIAVGCARVVGFRLVTNFKQPYFSASIGEFWKRWHISLSTWLTDYVYTPLTKARWLKLGWYPKFLISLLLTFLVSGLWHGANWTFVVWGALHGCYLMTSMVTQKLRARFVKASGLARAPRFLRALNVAFTFGLVYLSFIFFRAANLSDAWHILLRSVSGLPGFGLDLLALRFGVLEEFVRVVGLVEFTLAVAGLSVVLLVDLVQFTGAASFRNLWQHPGFRRTLDVAVMASILLFGLLYGQVDSGFIYFQF